MKLKEWREGLPLSQQALSRALEMPQSTIQRIESGKPPTLRNAMIIVEGSGGYVTYPDLIPGKMTRRLNRARNRVLEAY